MSVFKLSKHKTLEVYAPRLPADRWRKGISILGGSCSVHWRGDHAPSFYLELCVLGIQLIEIHFYDSRQEEDRA
jgi:hypothetical protein